MTEEADTCAQSAANEREAIVAYIKTLTQRHRAINWRGSGAGIAGALEGLADNISMGVHHD